jgi:hypothetical protein
VGASKRGEVRVPGRRRQLARSGDEGFFNDPGLAFANCGRPNFYRENFRRPADSTRRVFCAVPMWHANQALRIGTQPIEDQNNWRHRLLKRATRESGSGPPSRGRRFNPVGISFALVGPGDLLAFPLRPLGSRCDRFRRLGKSGGPPPVRTVFERPGGCCS